MQISFRSGKADDCWMDVCRLSAAAPKYIGKCDFYIMVSIFCICRSYHRHDYSHILFYTAKKNLLHREKKVTYALFSHHNGDIIVKKMQDMRTVCFGGFITGKIIDSAIVGGLCFIAMTIFQFPYPPLISVIIGVANVIPFFGPYIGAIPSILLILLVDPLQALYFLILFWYYSRLKEILLLLKCWERQQD